jgi:hypothetical protein
MAVALLFWTVALGTCMYAAWCGGKDGRWFAFFYLTACLLTLCATWINFDWSSVNWLTFGIDFGLWLGLAWLALRSKHFWPIWVFGIHSITITTHLASLVRGSAPVQAYFILATMTSLPKLLIVAVGIHMDRRFVARGLPHDRIGEAKSGR